jgi:acyl carrier protein
LGLYPCSGRTRYKEKDERDRNDGHLKGGKDLETKNILKEFILTVASQHQDSLADDQMLIESEIIDSLGILKLISFIEEKFGIQILDEELIPENFQTVNDISILIEEKQKLKT